MLADITIVVAIDKFQVNVFRGGDFNLLNRKRLPRATGDLWRRSSVLGNRSFDTFVLRCISIIPTAHGSLTDLKIVCSRSQVSLLVELWDENET